MLLSSLVTQTPWWIIDLFFNIVHHRISCLCGAWYSTIMGNISFIFMTPSLFITYGIFRILLSTSFWPVCHSCFQAVRQKRKQKKDRLCRGEDFVKLIPVGNYNRIITVTSLSVSLEKQITHSHKAYDSQRITHLHFHTYSQPPMLRSQTLRK